MNAVIVGIAVSKGQCSQKSFTYDYTVPMNASSYCNLVCIMSLAHKLCFSNRRFSFRLPDFTSERFLILAKPEDLIPLYFPNELYLCM